MQEWEYKIMAKTRRPDVNELNKLGDQGWELVVGTYGSDTGDFTLIFKRPKN